MRFWGYSKKRLITANNPGLGLGLGGLRLEKIDRTDEVDSSIGSLGAPIRDF